MGEANTTIHTYTYINLYQEFSNFGFLHVCLCSFILEKGNKAKILTFLHGNTTSHDLALGNSLQAYPDMDSLLLPRPLTSLGGRFGGWYTPLLIVSGVRCPGVLVSGDLCSKVRVVD